MSKSRCQFSRSLKVVVIVVMALGASACGVQFLYNNLDFIARIELRTYVDMTAEQEAFFEQEFSKIWNWHREVELPSYAHDLDDWSLRLEDGVSDADVDLALTSLRAWWHRMETHGKPSVIEFLSRLEDAQVVRMRDVFAKENAKQEKRMQKETLEGRRREWRKNLRSLLEDYAGRLHPDQRAFLTAGAEDYSPVPELWFEYSLRWQEEFLSLLHQRRDKDAFESGLSRLFGPQEPYYSKALNEAQAHNEALSKEVIVSVLASMNEAQLQRFSETLTDRARDFRELAAQAMKR